MLAAERSKTGLKPGDAIVIRYTHIDREKLKGFAGPRTIPILKMGAVYPAFLNRQEDAKTYTPAAYGESFRMTPEG